MRGEKVSTLIFESSHSYLGQCPLALIKFCLLLVSFGFSLPLGKSKRIVKGGESDGNHYHTQFILLPSVLNKK